MARKILEEISTHMNELTKSQRKVANFIVSNPLQAAFSTIEQLSRECQTSTATVVRLASHFGYEGFADFQKDLQNSIQKVMAPSYRLEENYQQISSSDATIQDIISIQMSNLKNTFDNIPGETLHQLAKRIIQSSHIYIIGARSCHGVAHYLAYNLNRITGKADLLDPFDASVSEKLLRIMPSDIVISVGFPRYISSVVTTTRLAKSQGAYIYVISDNPSSPLAEYADKFIGTNCKSYDFHNSTLSASLIAEVLISLVTRENPPMVKSHLKELEKVLDEFTTHINHE